MVNNIENNTTISEIDAKKDLKRLLKIKNAELKKYKIHTSKQKELLNLFNDLIKTILINNGNNNDNENKNDNENENVNEIKQLNDSSDKMIDESKSFEEQIKLLKKVKNLNEYWHCRRYGDKELKFKIFQANLANCSNFIDEELFAKIFGYTLVTLANKLINTANKEENHIIVNDIEKNIMILYKQDDDYNYVIQPSDQRIDLIDAIKLLLEFNDTI